MYFFRILSEGSLFVRWSAFFIATCLVAVMIQLFLLPYAFPGLHAGHGLMRGGDAIGFHTEAVILSNHIVSTGWGAWELRPGGNAPIGIAAALYAILLPAPYVLIPLNAALHALAGAFLAEIVGRLSGNRMIGFASALPLLFFPSAASWYSQIHKDGFFIAGTVLLFYAWVLLIEPSRDYSRRFLAGGVALTSAMAGIVLIWVVRRYALEPFQFAAVAVAALGLGLRVMGGIRRPPSSPLLPWLSIVLLFTIPLIMQQFRVASWVTDGSNRSIVSTQAQSIDPAGPSVPDTDSRGTAERWQKTAWLPVGLDNAIYSIIRTRDGSGVNSLYAKARSNVDMDISISSAGQALAYLPRAAQIGLLGPFPSDWVAHGTSKEGTTMRRLVVFEMIIWYFLFIAFPFAIWIFRHSPAFWILVSICIGFVILYAFVFPNLGTLHRMRYVFITTMASFSIAGIYRIIHGFSIRNVVRK